MTPGVRMREKIPLPFVGSPIPGDFLYQNPRMVWVGMDLKPNSFRPLPWEPPTGPGCSKLCPTWIDWPLLGGIWGHQINPSFNSFKSFPANSAPIHNLTLKRNPLKKPGEKKNNCKPIPNTLRVSQLCSKNSICCILSQVFMVIIISLEKGGLAWLELLLNRAQTTNFGSGKGKKHPENLFHFPEKYLDFCFNYCFGFVFFC